MSLSERDEVATCTGVVAFPKRERQLTEDAFNLGLVIGVGRRKEQVNIDCAVGRSFRIDAEFDVRK